MDNLISRFVTLCSFIGPVFNPPKFVRSTKKHKSMSHTHGEKNQSIEIVTEEAQRLDLLDKELKSAHKYVQRN